MTFCATNRVVRWGRQAVLSETARNKNEQKHIREARRQITRAKVGLVTCDMVRED